MLNKLIVISALSVILISETGFSQDSLWSRIYGHGGAGNIEDSDRGMCGTVTSDSGYAISGVSYHFYENLSQIWLVKTDINGAVEWTANYGTSGYEEAHYIAETSDKGFIICGETKPLSGSYDLYLVRTDQYGDTIWTNSYGAAGFDDKGWGVVETNDHGFVAVGQGYNNGSSDIYLVRTDSSGALIWEKHYGGPFSEYASEVVQTSDGGFALAGFYSNNDYGDSDLWLLKTDSNGDSLWTRKFSYGGGWSRAEALALTEDNGFCVAGQNWYTYSLVNVLVIKTDSLGNWVWHREFGGSGIDNAYSIAMTNDSGYVIGGQTKSFGNGLQDYYIIRTDNNGDSLWASYYGYNGIDYCREIRVDPNNDVICFGQKHDYGSQDFDYWLIKISDSALVSLTSCDYETGDINGSGSYNGLDVTYGVAYLKGGSPPVLICDCPPHGSWHVAGDVNGSCNFNGLDITHGVAYLKGGGPLESCPDCPSGR